MRIALNIIALLFSISCHSQIEQYLDLDYGDNGIAHQSFTGIPFVYTKFNINPDRKAVVAMNEYQYLDSEFDSIVWCSRLIRFNANGKIENWGYETSCDTTFDNNNFWSYKHKFYTLIDDNIYVSKIDSLDSGKSKLTLTEIDENQNPLSEYCLEYSHQLYYYYYTNYSALGINEDGEIYNNVYGNLVFINNDGSPMREVEVNPATNMADTINNFLWGAAIQDQDGAYYVQTTNTIDVTNSNSIKFRIDKVHEEGYLMDNYNSIQPMESEIIVGMNITEDNSLIVRTFFYDSLCLSYPYKSILRKYDKQGNLDSSWALEGELDSSFNNCIDFAGPLLIGPGNEILQLFTSQEFNEDSTLLISASSYLRRIDPEGSYDNKFGLNGKIDLSPLPGENWWQVDMDDANNLYILSAKSNSTPQDNELYIVKLRAETLWSELPEIEVDSDIASMELFPNPTSNGITLHYEGPELENVSIEVVNMLGQRVGILDRETIIPGSETYLDTYAYPSGQYYIRVIDREKALRLLEEKFMIIN